MAKLAIFLVALVAVCSAQNDGRYRPFPQKPFVAVRPTYQIPSARRYRPSGDGRYTPDNSGRYDANDGRYVPDDSGRYNPDGSGAYSGSAEKYIHKDVAGGDYSGSGGAGDKYKGDNNKYKGDANAGDKYKGTGFGAGAGTGFGTGSGTGAVKPVTSPFGAGTGSVVKRPITSSANAIGAAAGFGTPVTLKQGSAAGKYDNRNYAIIRQDGKIEEDGYHYLYETENGIIGEEQGKLHNRGSDAEAMKATGFYEYTGPDNVVYTVHYSADEEGFVPQAAHIPTPPPIPELILRALEYQRQQGTL